MGSPCTLSHNTHQLDLPEGSAFPKLKAHCSCPPFLPALSVVHFSLEVRPEQGESLLWTQSTLESCEAGLQLPQSGDRIAAVRYMQEAQ